MLVEVENPPVIGHSEHKILTSFLKSENWFDLYRFTALMILPVGTFAGCACNFCSSFDRKW